MKSIQRLVGGGLAIAALVVTAIVYDVRNVRSSDHQDSPTVVARPAADITDVFVYPNPNEVEFRPSQYGMDFAISVKDSLGNKITVSGRTQ